MPYPKEDTVRFVSVMRIMKDKGIQELLEAARRIHEKHPETVFELLGAYEEETRARYEPMIEDLQSKGIVRYYGYRDDMPEFYRHCQAVIHPSYHEGMSNVLQEAAATARPVIASDINGCREIFENGVSGSYIFTPECGQPDGGRRESSFCWLRRNGPKWDVRREPMWRRILTADRS